MNTSNTLANNTFDASPSLQEIEKIKEQLAALRRQQEYANLKKELAEVTAQAVNTPNEFEGAMQLPDSEKVLQTKRSTKQFSEILLARVIKMLSIRPIIGNIIALGIAAFALIFLNTELTLSHGQQYQHYIGIGLLTFAAIQIIKSSTRSLLIPILATILGAVISHSLASSETLLTYSANFYQYLMITGIIGLGISVLTID